MVAGSKSRSVVRQPKLKVEQSAPSAQVLKGRSVQFQITVSNPGDGPARNVTVQAKLSPGLRHESGEPNDQNVFEQTIDMIRAGERVQLDTLVAVTTQGGEQSCTVVATSPDVTPSPPEAKNTQVVNVVEPKMTMAISGPKERYAETLANYDVTLSNPGTAPARNVRVQATVPTSARLVSRPQGAQFDPQTRRLTWSRPQLSPGENAVFSFQVRVGGIALLEIAAEARADGALSDKGTFTTDVKGLADVSFEVGGRRRVIDVDGETTFAIKVVNSGTKEATKVTISANYSENITPVGIFGLDEGGKYNKGSRQVIFPLIPRLAPGRTVELGIRVKADKPGQAWCRVSLTHDDLTEKLDSAAAFKITSTRR
jgi:uncharacterized repeat protein (TIGR01451 family)